MAFNVQKLPFCPPSPVDKSWLHIITGVAKGDTRAHSPIPLWLESLKKGEEEVGNWSMPLQNLPLIMAKNAVLIHTFKNLPHPPPLGNFAPSLCPPLTNPGHTTVSGVAIMGYKGLGPPLIGETKQKLKNWGLISLLMCKKCIFWYAS